MGQGTIFPAPKHTYEETVSNRLRSGKFAVRLSKTNIPVHRG